MRKNLNLNASLWQLLIISTILFITGCKKDEVKPNNNSSINTWIDSNMRYIYYWNDKIPSSVDKSKNPKDYFDALLYKQEDRFSWIRENFTDLINSLNGIAKEAGYDLKVYRESESNNNVIAQITYIKPNSPASDAGLKRGDVITKINSTQITIDNYQDLLNNKIAESHSVTYNPLDAANEQLLSPVTKSLNVVEYTENPNYLSKVITIGDKKIGYYVYNFFAPGNGDNYDTEMDNIFGQFKSEGITDLVLDFRFNSGGAVSSATNLASLIAPSITKNDVFYKSTFNAQAQRDILADPEYGPDFLIEHFKEKSQNIGSLLSGKKVYILTGEYTASASELIINGLRPYMTVYLIGETTYGKNVASTTIYDPQNPNNKWGLQPIILKTSNSKDESNYSNGFTPDIQNSDNDLYILPLGDNKETLLSLALENITGTTIVARKSNETKLEFVNSSVSLKPRSFAMTVQSEKFKKFLTR